jgi:predicted ester cyclase
VSAEENKAISNRVAETIGKGDLDAFDDLMAADLAEEFKRDIAEIRRAFPDYAGTNVNQIAEVMGVAPTGRRVVFVGHSIDRVVEGRIVESWVEVDLLGVLQQLGAIPAAGESEEANPT